MTTIIAYQLPQWTCINFETISGTGPKQHQATPSKTA